MVLLESTYSILPFPRSMCKLQRNVNGSEPEASNRSLPSLDLLLDLLKNFSDLHHPSFAEATLSSIVTRGGPKGFDFRGHVMFFGLCHRNDNPGTAFSIGFADCLPVNVLIQELPDVKEALQASEARYNSVANHDKATMKHFAGLIRVVYQTNGCICVKNVPIRDDPKGDAANRANWLFELQFAVNHGLVAKNVGNAYQSGKIVKQGSRWKWVPVTDLS
jgi:hypothetical protein